MSLHKSKKQNNGFFLKHVGLMYELAGVEKSAALSSQTMASGKQRSRILHKTNVWLGGIFAATNLLTAAPFTLWFTRLSLYDDDV